VSASGVNGGSTNGHAPTAWDDEADFVVLGSGCGALAGAATAAAEGLSVIVLERASSSVAPRRSRAVAPGSDEPPHARSRPSDDSRLEALTYVRAVSGDQGDDELNVAYVDHAAPMIEYLEQRAGIEFRPWPAVGGTLDYRPWLPGAKPGGRTVCSPKFATADLGEWSSKLRFGMVSGWTMDPLDYYRNRMHVKPFGSATPRRGADTDAIPEFVASGTALMGQMMRACLTLGVDLRTETRGAS